jgi:hypothetical protein
LLQASAAVPNFSSELNSRRAVVLDMPAVKRSRRDTKEMRCGISIYQIV